ncbi:MAG: hypothetical protein ACQETI_02715, partial [Halobacteriota archaeon]
ATSTPRSEPTDTPTRPSADDVPELVRRYAPDLYFGRLEKWFPTDPRQYVRETDSGSVVDGFTALDAYTASFVETGDPPTPTVFYNVVEAADGVDAIQYWLYSVFDQFTVNFHWHDWELLQVFVERSTGNPLLLSASAHSRSVPNNEFLDPDISGDQRPGILAEVGSHSSASEVNGLVPSFERVPVDTWQSDVSNDFVGATPQRTEPLAYGLPRDEGARLPFVMLELDGTRLDRHPALSVGREAFIHESVTVDSWYGLPRPPTGLPFREPGLVMAHPDSPTAADATYDLRSIAVVRDLVDDFVGPQLSFEFVIPGFVEDMVAGHITSVGIPWEQSRFTNPLDDVTDPAHRHRIDGRTPSALQNRVVGRVRQLRSGADGALDRVATEAREALEGTISVSLSSLPVEAVTRLASENPVTSVTRSGLFAFLRVAPGDHLLVVNGPGMAPLAERFVHEGGLFRAGAGGYLTVVASEDAAWIRGDGRATTGIDRVRIVEDFAGVVYVGRPVESDRFAVAVHRDGRYTVELVDADGRPGTYRVGPGDFGDESEMVFDDAETGKVALSRTLRGFLVDLGELTRTLAERDGASGEVPDRVSIALEEATAAATVAERGDPRAANNHLSGVVSHLQSALKVLLSDAAGGYTNASVAGLDPRIREAIGRAEVAIQTGL